MTISKQIKVLTELKETLTHDDPFMCINLEYNLSIEPSRTDRENLIKELWQDVVKARLEGEAARYIINLNSSTLSLSPFQGAWYDRDDLDTRKMNINRTIKRLQSKIN